MYLLKWSLKIKYLLKKDFFLSFEFIYRYFLSYLKKGIIFNFEFESYIIETNERTCVKKYQKTCD